MNHSKEKALIQNRMLKNMRAFFDAQNFLEVMTPSLVDTPGMEPNLDPISAVVPQNHSTKKGFLITSPEYQMKRLLSSGLEKIWQLCSAYRGNEEKSPLHATEFKILEYYIAGIDYLEMADFTEKLVKAMILPDVKSSHVYRECTIQDDHRFKRISCKDAFKKYLNVNLDHLYTNTEKFIKTLQKKGFDVNKNQSTEDIFWTIFLQYIEPRLGHQRPEFLFDYPSEMAALSKISKNNPLYCERFELYISGIEVANAFSELTDPNEQLKRLKNEQKERLALKKEVYEIDNKFIKALELGMPESSGVALGFDRLAMIAANKESVHDVMFFSNEINE